MSARQTSAAQWAGIAIAIVGMLGGGWKSAVSYGALEQRVTRLEADRAADAVELRAIRILVTRLCAVTPGCVEH